MRLLHLLLLSGRAPLSVACCRLTSYRAASLVSKAFMSDLRWASGCTADALARCRRYHHLLLLHSRCELVPVDLDKALVDLEIVRYLEPLVELLLLRKHPRHSARGTLDSLLWPQGLLKAFIVILVLIFLSCKTTAVKVHKAWDFVLTAHIEQVRWSAQRVVSEEEW